MIDAAATALAIALIVAMACGLEITWPLGLICTVMVLLDPNLTFVIIPQRISANPNSFSMSVIPAFTLAGDIMSKGGPSRWLVALTDSLVGWISGGTSLVSIIVYAFSTAISGSPVATTATIGDLVYSEMFKRGYPENYSAAVQAIGGTLGIVIPPSIVLIIYGNIAGTPVGDLSMTGVIPGVICCIFLCVCAYCKAKKHKFPKAEKSPSKRFLHSSKGTIWALVMLVIILDGIYARIFTSTKSMVIAVVYGTLVCLLIHREVVFKSTWEIIQSAVVRTVNLMIPVVTARTFGWLITHYKIPQLVTRSMLSHISTKYTFWGIIILPSIVCGVFLEVGATGLILVLILVLIAAAFGMDSVHLGPALVFPLAMGRATLSFGTCLLVSCGISKRSTGTIFRQVVPFIPVETTCDALFAMVPILPTLLPNPISG